MSTTKERHCKWHGPYQSVNESKCPSCEAVVANGEEEPSVPDAEFVLRLYKQGQCIAERGLTRADAQNELWYSKQYALMIQRRHERTA